MIEMLGTDLLKDVVFDVKILQQPLQARMCGLGQVVSKRMLDPPLILQVDIHSEICKEKTEKIRNDDDENEDCSTILSGLMRDTKYEQLMISLEKLLMCNVALIDASTLESQPFLILPPSKRHEQKVQTLLLGSTSKTSVYMETPFNKTMRHLFLFTDLAIRIQGDFRLQCFITNMASLETKTITTESFRIYSPQFYPGILDPTPLSKWIHCHKVSIRSVCNSKKTRYKGQKCNNRLLKQTKRNCITSTTSSSDTSS